MSVSTFEFLVMRLSDRIKGQGTAMRACVVYFYPFGENRLPKMRRFPSMLSNSQFYLYNYQWFFPIKKACSRLAQLV